MHHAESLPCGGAFFLGKSDNLCNDPVCSGVVSGPKIGPRGMRQRVHQCGGLADLPRILERALAVGEGSLGVAQQPKRPRSITQHDYADVLAKSCRQPTMFGRIVE